MQFSSYYYCCDEKIRTKTDFDSAEAEEDDSVATATVRTAPKITRLQCQLEALIQDKVKL